MLKRSKIVLLYFTEITLLFFLSIQDFLRNFSDIFSGYKIRFHYNKCEIYSFEIFVNFIYVYGTYTPLNDSR